MKKIIPLMMILILIFVACERKTEPPVKIPELPAKTVQPIKKPIPSSTEKTDQAKANEVAANSTVLMKKIAEIKDASDPYCTKSKYKLLGPRNKLPLEDTEEFKEELKRVLEDENDTNNLIQQVKEFISANQDNDDIGFLRWVCKKEKNTYVSFGTKGISYNVSLWKNKNSFEFFREASGNIAFFGMGEGGTLFFTGVLDGKSLIYSGSRDFPFIYWTIDSLDPDQLLVTRLEACEMEFESDPKTYVVNTDKYTFACDKQYAP